jgi:hypothetical protein
MKPEVKLIIAIGKTTTKELAPGFVVIKVQRLLGFTRQLREIVEASYNRPLTQADRMMAATLEDDISKIGEKLGVEFRFEDNPEAVVYMKTQGLSNHYGEDWIVPSRFDEEEV